MNVFTPSHQLAAGYVARSPAGFWSAVLVFLPGTWAGSWTAAGAAARARKTAFSRADLRDKLVLTGATTGAAGLLSASARFRMTIR